MRIELRPTVRLSFSAVPDPLDVGHIKFVSRPIVKNGSRVPTHRNQTLQLRFFWRKTDDSHCVLGSITNKKSLTRIIKRQRVRTGPEQIAGILARPDCLYYLVIPKIEHTYGIAGGVGYHQEPVIGRQSHRARVQTHLHLGFHPIVLQIDNGNRAFVGDETRRIHPDQCAATGRPPQLLTYAFRSVRTTAYGSTPVSQMRSTLPVSASNSANLLERFITTYKRFPLRETASPDGISAFRRGALAAGNGMEPTPLR